MQRGRPVLTLDCTVSTWAYLKNLIIRREGKICHFMIKKGKEKYEELLLSCILYSNINYQANNLQAKNCSLVAITKQ